jgi:putative hydrolase of the HAD superfamily
MRYDGVLFDYGNTLVSYGTREDWPDVLTKCIANVTQLLRNHRLMHIPVDRLPERVQAQRIEFEDHRVYPLIERLRRIYDLQEAEVSDELALEACRQFLQPIFAFGNIYDDTMPTLTAIRQRGLKTAIVSNTPWGSPGAIWREEVTRHGLSDAVDEMVFCTDVGYRKPAAEPFRLALTKLGLQPEQCVFIGDDPRWDIAGPRAIGMDAIFIDRNATGDSDGAPVIRSLDELPKTLSA